MTPKELIESEQPAEEIINEFFIRTNVVDEKFSDQDVATIRKIAKGRKLVALRKPLEDAGFKPEFAFEPYAHFSIKKGGETYLLINRKYVDDPEWVEGEIAGGRL